MAKINAKHIAAFRIEIDKICTDYKYKTEKKFLGFITRKEGFYDILDEFVGDRWAVERKNKEVLVGTKSVHYKPHLFFFLSSGNTSTKYFDSKIELKRFIDDNNLNSINWLNID